MRILVLLHDAFGGLGGIAKFNRDLLTALASHPRIDEIVALPRHIPDLPGPIPPKIVFDQRGAGGKLPYLGALARQLLADSRFALIISGHLNLLSLAALCRLVTGAPVVATIHGIDAWTPTIHPIANRLARRLDYAISVSEITKERFIGWTGLDPQRIFILPNCVDPQAFGPGARSGALASRYSIADRPALLTLARLVSAERYKGIDEILEIMPRLIATCPDLVYLIAGDGPDRKRLEAKAANLGLAGHVIFCGRIAEAEKADHYRLADAFVMPGRGEGFGIVYLEAMACGVPVVGSVLDGSREALLGGRLGILVDPRDPSLLERAILEALGRPKGIPAGLDTFFYRRFEERMHAMVVGVLPAGGPRPVNRATALPSR